MAEIIFEGTIVVKFIYSEKATTFSEIFTLLLSYVVPVKSKVKILQKGLVQLGPSLYIGMWYPDTWISGYLDIQAIFAIH